MMRTASPAFVPRNHLVNEALSAATEIQDSQPFEEIVNVVSRPYEDRSEFLRYARQLALRSM
jgi:uncharacterized protein YdiU (UPF0061 family)